ncbi:MAG: hypothetical protein R2832_19210 [Rhodothermales bacterium]
MLFPAESAADAGEGAAAGPSERRTGTRHGANVAKKLGAGAFIFFLAKGLLWLAVGAVGFVVSCG